jgi:hypothetical protein
MPPKALRFGIRNHPKHTTTHELHHTAGTTSPSVTPWEFAGVVWEVACCSWRNQDGPTTPTAPKTEVSGGNGTWDAAGGHLNGTWPPRVARSYPPFVTQRNLLNQATQKSQYVPKRKAHLLFLPFCAFDEGFQGAFGPAKWHVVRNECHDMKGKFAGHYGGHNSPPALQAARSGSDLEVPFFSPMSNPQSRTQNSSARRHFPWRVGRVAKRIAPVESPVTRIRPVKTLLVLARILDRQDGTERRRSCGHLPTAQIDRNDDMREDPRAQQIRAIS